MRDLKDYILYLPNFLPVELCNTVVDTYQDSKSWKQHSWYNAKEDRFNQYSHDCYILAPQESLETAAVAKYLDVASDEAIKQYCKKFAVEGMIKNRTFPRLNRYDVDTHMSPHFDHIQSIFDGEEKGIPILSVIGNLNRNYVGGELKFFRQDMLLMNVGDLVVFPSCFLYTHEVTAVEQGTRYSYVSWAY
jgi:predicted 2-oxoglutarate/Fe(II)-dependent dioxygenase YbiX